MPTRLKKTEAMRRSFTAGLLGPTSLQRTAKEFPGRAQTRFHGAVHVALPAFAGVFPGEDHPSRAAGQQGAPGGIEPGIQESVSAARPRILFPGKPGHLSVAAARTLTVLGSCHRPQPAMSA